PWRATRRRPRTQSRPEERRGRAVASCGHLRVRDLLLQRIEDVRDLLVHDRLEDALPHAPDRPGDVDVGDPVHLRSIALDRLEMELRVHPDDRADALALRAQLRVLDRARLDLLELELQ